MCAFSSFFEFLLRPVIGIEIEFFFSNPKLIEEVKNSCKEKCKLFFEIEKEEGLNQYEIKTRPTTNISLLLQEEIIIKKIIQEIAQRNSCEVNFSAKPFLDQPGNSLHIHVNLLNKSGYNIFENKNYLMWAVAGLCKFMKSSMLIFAPEVECYKRYQYPDKNTPTTISWGYNNRTTAIRIVSNRIEHRVPCSNSHLESTIYEISKSILYGIENKESCMNPIYGVASDSIYNLKKLPITFSEAKRHRIGC